VIVITEKTFNFIYQPQEEAGSAEEQPASNKADTLYGNNEQSAMAAFFFITGKSHSLKKLNVCILFMLLLLFDILYRLIILHAAGAIIFGQCE
jgi:hypothetical protein